ncbi:uncharacterized protein [Argopecten irradians]|uniref:uncharacterized protein n=1 Tax=Argopecten irradians TaxID=31199 RepID=UPI00370FA1AA
MDWLGGRYNTAGKKGLFVSIINIRFNMHMEGFPDLEYSNMNKNILPFKEFFDNFEPLSLVGQKNPDYHVNVSYSGFGGIIRKVGEKNKTEEYGCLAVSISSHGYYIQKNEKLVHHLLCGEPKQDDGDKGERWISTEYILKEFEKNFDGPIIFLIQACRGENEDSGSELCCYTDNTEPNQGGTPLDSGIESLSLTDQSQGPEGPDATESTPDNSSNTPTNSDPLDVSGTMM